MTMDCPSESTGDLRNTRIARGPIRSIYGTRDEYAIYLARSFQEYISSLSGTAIRAYISVHATNADDPTQVRLTSLPSCPWHF